MEGRLIIVSNRLPVTCARLADGGWELEPSAGGLVAGLAEVHAQSESVWIGHAGVFDHDAELTARLARDRLVPVAIEKETYDAYYNGMSNGAIWPLFHYRSDSMAFSYSDWHAYEVANRCFADAVCAIARPGDRVWIHDYQLMLLPELLRERAPGVHIAYFHHIPFPSADVFRMFPGRVAILRGLLGADLVGFHTIDYVQHFAVAITRVLGIETHLDRIYHEGRSVGVGAFPLAIDGHSFEVRSQSEAVREEVVRLRAGLADQKILLGVDRLDYTKGIPERIQAFRELLRANPALVRHVTFLQLSVPSRIAVLEYGNLRNQVEQLVGKVNGEFGEPGYVPVQYLHRSIPPDELVALYKVADVAVVTPLRDGLNLVCKEYVATRADCDGVLLLSEFAGAAAEMGEALLVNPYDEKAVAGAMLQALEMPIEERQRRMRLLRERTMQTDNIAWSRAFLASWDEARRRDCTRSVPLVGAAHDEVLHRLANTRSYLFLDHDGTLTPIAARPELALPSDAVMALLESLGSLPSIEATIVTGRSRAFCDRYLARLPFNLVAEHGAYLRRRGTTTWQNLLIAEGFAQILPVLQRVFEHYTRCVPGALIEEKELSIAWHYRLADPIVGRAMALELVEALGQLLRSTPYAVFPSRKAIEVRPEVATKAHAVTQVLSRCDWRDGDVILSAGDDVTDEDMYRIHEDVNLSIHVGSPDAVAKYHVSSPEALLRFLAEVRDACQRSARALRAVPR